MSPQGHLKADKPELFKNVVIWYSHNTSAGYLAKESWPNDNIGMTPNLCTTECFGEESEERLSSVGFATTREKFQTADGIQYWHFKIADIVYQTSNEEALKNRSDIRYWISKLEEKLTEEGKGEKIDAIIVPLGMCLTETQGMMDFFTGFKEKTPNAKIIVHNPNTRSGSDRNGFVDALSEGAMNTIGMDRIIIRRGEDGKISSNNGEEYDLAPFIDIATSSCTSSGKLAQNVLREAIDLPALEEKKRGF